MTMTLQEIMPAVRQLPAVEKIELLHFLEQEAAITIDELPAAEKFASLYFGEGKTQPDPDTLFEKGKTYHIYTPYDCPGAPAILLAELEKCKAENSL